MTKFLRTKAISSSIEDIIANAEETIGILSPYPKIHENFLQRLKEADDRGIKINFILGKKKSIPNDQYNFLVGFKNIEIKFLEELHAKCYYNEKTMVICSMNLHTYSEEFNREMGILISSEKDSNAYNDAKKEIKSIIGKAEFVKKRTSDFSQSNPEKAEKPELGFCIRCEKSIKYDYYYPYCPECYKTWKKFKNRDYPENVCHACRQEWKTTLNHPVCDMCSEEYKNSRSPKHH
ncbi:MAG: phospholipase D family protein [Promethearchaeota archaeon]